MRDYIQQHRNHYPELEAAAETLGGALSDPLSMAEPMRRRLKEAWGMTARVVPQAELGNFSQYLRPRAAAVPDLDPSCVPRTGPSRSPTSWRWSSSPPILDRMVAEAAAARRGHRPAAPHEPRQLCRRGDHDALRPLPRRLRGDALFDRPAVRRVRRQCRAGRAPVHDAEPAGRTRRALLHAAGRSRPGTSPSAMPATNFPSRASAAPARAGTSTPPSRPPARSSPS